MPEPILITGAGIVSAIGLNKAETLDSLINERTGICQLKYLKTEHTDYPVGEVKLSDSEMGMILGLDNDIPSPRTFLMGALAMKEALEESRLLNEEKHNVALVSGTTVGGMDKSEQYYLDYLDNDSKNA